MTELTSYKGGLAGIAKGAPTSLADAVKEVTRILCSDVSGSMARPAGGEVPKRKIDALRDVVYAIRSEGVEFKQIVFGTLAGAELREDIPEPTGSTPLHLAIDLAATQRASRLVVISDGFPDVADLALASAARLGVPIDTFYVGPPGGPGEDFMRRLATATGGGSHVGDLGAGVKAISDGVKKALLALPESIAL